MVIDVVDGTDPSLVSGEASVLGPSAILLYGMSNGVSEMVTQVIDRTGGRLRSISLLRFHGHGAPGAMNVTAGEADHDSSLGGIAVSNLARVRATLARLRPYFGPDARVELHGCNVGSGRAGAQLLSGLVSIWGVPVSAGIRTQYGGGEEDSVRFEGPVHTCHPTGRCEIGEDFFF